MNNQSKSYHIIQNSYSLIHNQAFRIQAELNPDDEDQENSVRIDWIVTLLCYRSLHVQIVKASTGEVLWEYIRADSKLFRPGTTFAIIRMKEVKSQTVYIKNEFHYFSSIKKEISIES